MPTPNQAIPDTLPADFFNQPQTQGAAAAPAAAPTSTQTPDTLPADFFSKQPGSTTNAAQPPSDHDSVLNTDPITGKKILDLGTGILKGASDTANTVSKLLNKIPGVGQYLAPSSGIAAANQLETPKGPDQQIGSGLENLAEFFLGDESLKALSLAERLGLASKVASLAEKHPIVAKIIGHGLASFRAGTVTTGQQLAHGASVPDAVTTGAEVAGTGTVVGAAASGISHIFTPGIGVETVEEHAARNAAKAKLPAGSASSVAPTSADIQPNLQQGIHDVLSDVSKASGVDAPNPNTVRDASRNVADQVLAKSKDAYRQLDEASGGRWQRFDDQLKNVRNKMAEVAGIDDDQYAALEQKQNEIETSQAQLIEDLKSTGKVNPALADEARDNYKKAQSLYDVDANVKMSTTGRAGVGKGVETVDPNKLAPRLHKLYDSGRLQQAVGEDQAKALIDHAETAQASTKAIKDFTPSSPTGQQAMQDLLRPNTTGKAILPGAKTDFLKSFRDFDAMPADEKGARFGPDAEQARTYLKAQARNQLIKKWGFRVGLGAIAHETGLDKAVLHAIWD